MIRTDTKYFWPLTVFLDAARYTVSERDPQGLHVGDQVRVTLLSTDFERGHLDFARTH